MKGNSIKSGGRHRGVLVLLAAICACAVAFAAAMGFSRLREAYEEQCVIEDIAEQVDISSGKMVKPDVIAENLGLRVGTNLARIDFAERREEILKKIPTLRDISITRTMPRRLRIVAEERVPVARLGLRGRKGVTGRVVDSEGMVFFCQRGTHLLPTIVEPRAPGTQSGHRISGRARAALSLVEACREPDFVELGVQDVDISRPDYLLATLADYSRLKIAWDGMDSPSSKSRAELERRLGQLLRVIRSRVGMGAKIWNATLPDRIFADTQGDTPKP